MESIQQWPRLSRGVCVCFFFFYENHSDDYRKILCVDWENWLKERAGSVEVEAMLSRTAPIFNGDIRSHERVQSIFLNSSESMIF